MIYSCTKLFCLVRTELEQHNVFRILAILDANLNPISPTLTSTPLLRSHLSYTHLYSIIARTLCFEHNKFGIGN